MASVEGAVHTEPQAPSRRGASRFSPSRRRFLKRALFATGALAAADMGYAFSARVSHRTLWFRNLPAGCDGLRILHLSDFHHGPIISGAYLQSAVARARAIPHDIACLTGDFVSEDSAFAAIYPDLLAGWRPPLGLFATLGNHDHYYEPEVVRRALETAGCTVLMNQSARLARGGDTLWVAGVDDPSTDRHDLPQAMESVEGPGFRLLLAHSPDIAWSLKDNQVDLVLSGHTHGGQVCLPGGLPVVCPTNLGADYAKGVFLWRGATLFVNRGLGCVGLPFRLFCPPEIALLTLKRGIGL